MADKPFLDENGLRTFWLAIKSKFSFATMPPVGSYYHTSLRPKLESGETGTNMVDYFDPEEAWGGAWELLDEGIFLSSAGENHPVSAGTAKDGGSPDAVVVSHDHTAKNGAVGNNPSAFNTNSSGQVDISSSGAHKHVVQLRLEEKKLPSGTTYSRITSSGSNYVSSSARLDSGNNGGAHTHTVPNHTHSIPANSHTHNFTQPTIESKGVDGTGKNLPPYKNVWIWHRYA